MIMAYMRSGAQGWLHPYIDRPDIRFRVKWFRAHPNAQLFRLPTIFGWDQWRERRIGDVFPGFEWRYDWDRGSQLPLPPGTNYCGTPDQWLNGCLSTDPVPTIDPITQLPMCCNPGTAFVAGGLAVGGGVSGTMGLTLRGGLASEGTIQLI
jgi:hypothetical protein